jgi:Polysaccharide deacetylase
MTPQPTRTIPLAFHSVTDRITFGSTNYSPRRLKTLINHLRTFDSGVNDTAIRLTFDDGYAHLLEVLPELIDLTSFRPIVFIPTAFIGKSNSWDYGGRFRQMRHLNVNEIQSLTKIGVIFGSHSHSHCDLTMLNEHDLLEELTVSKQILSDIRNSPITDLSYPFGRHSARVEKAVAVSGYTAGYTMSFPADTDSPLSRGRIPVYFFDTTNSVLAKIRGHGLRYRFEKFRTQTAQKLSVGTVILQSLRGKKKTQRF